MAYPTVSAPYGLKPVNLIGGQVFSGSTRMYPVQYSYASNIFYGDLVNIVRGTVVKATGTTDVTAAGLVGVFLGCSYTNPISKQKTFAQYWPASTLAGDCMAVICDDPDTVFKAVVCSATTVIASGSTAVLGQNMGLIQNTGNTSTGNSAVALQYSATLTTSTFAARVVGLVGETSVATSGVGASSSTTITLTAALPNALVVGTEVAYVAANGQLVQTGSFVSAAYSSGTSVTINAAVAVPGSITAIPAASTIVFTQYPEVLVKLNFGAHSYYTATAV